MNATVNLTALQQTRLQQFLSDYRQRTPRLVIDQTAPRSNYTPDYVPHRDITLRATRKAGAK